MLSLIRRAFSKANPLVCGGKATCYVVDRIGRTVGEVHYMRPDSALKRNYAYDLQHKLMEESNLKQLSKSDNKAAAIHQNMVDLIIKPYMSKVFVGVSGGFVDAGGKKIQGYETTKQFEIMMQYYSNVMTDVVAVAYEQEGIVKKKL